MKINVLLLIFMFITIMSSFAQSPFFIIDEEIQEDGFIRFATNDRRMYNNIFYQIVTNPNRYNNIYEIDIIKSSGSYFTGYGMIFCANKSNFETLSCYVILITIDQQYMVGAIINGEKEDDAIINWTNSTNLNIDYGINNNIKIVETNNEFIIYFNGIETDSFGKNKNITGKMIGTYISISSVENELFPQIPVDVRYRANN